MIKNKLIIIVIFVIFVSSICTSCQSHAKSPINLKDLIYRSTTSLKGERIFYPTTDKLMGSGLLFLPRGNPPYPTILVNHFGGGTARSMKGIALDFTKQEYLAFCSDYRGCGYAEGKTEWAAGEVDDVLMAIKYLRFRGLTSNKIGAYGISHGATISIIAAAKEKDIDAVVAESGFYDMVDFYNHAGDFKGFFNDYCGGTPEQVPEEYAKRTALNYVDALNSPILLVHGKQDMVIPYQEVILMYFKLQINGKPAKLLLYNEEGHGIFSSARTEYMMKVYDWFNQFVRES